MKALARNKQTLYYALPTTYTDVTDENGFYTGEQTITYATPVKAEMNISPANGRTALEWFGISTNFTHVLVTDDMACPITESTILWIGKEPTVTVNGVTKTTPHNHVVSRIAKSLNSIVYGVTEVSVGE